MMGMTPIVSCSFSIFLPYINILKPHPLQLPIVKFGEVGAVLHLGQPSVAVMGIAPILYGESSPAGRTIQTIYELLAETLLMLWDQVARTNCLGMLEQH